MHACIIYVYNGARDVGQSLVGEEGGVWGDNHLHAVTQHAWHMSGFRVLK
jgi:hypothetical protein